MNRKDIIQNLINKISAQSYLEIGLGNGKVFEKIQCIKKVGVDPCEYPITKKHNIKPTFRLTSDDFFAQNKDLFDVIFIDGLHEAHQVIKDIQNSLKILNPNGYIVCHDMSPFCEDMQIIPMDKAIRLNNNVGNIGWTGDCWKAWVKLRSSNPNISMFVVDTDFGCGVIQHGSQDLLKLDLELTYSNFNANRKNWLNLISVDYFRENF